MLAVFMFFLLGFLLVYIWIIANEPDNLSANNHNEEFNTNIILTNSNGEGNTAKALKPHIDYLKTFEQIILCLDNDTAGKKAVQKIEQEIPLIFDVLNLGKLNNVNDYINDFTDLYKYLKEHDITGDVLEENLKLSVYSILKLYLKYPNAKLDVPKIVQIKPEHANRMNNFEWGIYPYKGSYYSIKYDIEEKKLTYTRKSNFTLHVEKTVVFNSFTFENHQEYRLEICTNIGNKTTQPIVLSQKDLLDSKNMHEILKEGGIHLHCLKDTELKNVILEELSNTTDVLSVYKNPSFILHQGNPYWVYKNAAIDLANGNVLISDYKSKGIIQVNSSNAFTLKTDRDMHSPELYVPNLSYNEFVEQNKSDELIVEFASCSNSIPELIAKCLFMNTIRTYGNKVEPFLTLGVALMSPFVDIIFAKTMGFPVNFMFGEAASGKSNLLVTIANLFGFNARFLSSGNDTAMNLLHNIYYHLFLQFLTKNYIMSLLSHYGQKESIIIAILFLYSILKFYIGKIFLRSIMQEQLYHVHSLNI